MTAESLENGRERDIDVVDGGLELQANRCVSKVDLMPSSGWNRTRQNASVRRRVGAWVDTLVDELLWWMGEGQGG